MKNYKEEVSKAMHDAEVKRIATEYINDIVTRYGAVLEDLKTDYRPTGETKQRIDWQTGEPLFDEEGNPRTENIYDYFQLSEEEWNSEENAWRRDKAEALESVLNYAIKFLK